MTAAAVHRHAALALVLDKMRAVSGVAGSGAPPGIVLDAMPRPALDAVPGTALDAMPKPALDAVPGTALDAMPRPALDAVPGTALGDAQMPALDTVPGTVLDAAPGAGLDAAQRTARETAPGAAGDTAPGAELTAEIDAVPALGSSEVSRHAVRLVVVDPAGTGPPRLERFAALPGLLRAGDLLVVNDAATLPASLPGWTAGGGVFELRLSGPVDAGRLFGVLLGPGDHRTRTEHRALPPRLVPGDRVTIAGLIATVAGAAGRRVELVVRDDGDALWQALYAAGAPVQYAHRSERLPLWSVQTAYAGRPWAAEMPSAGRPLTWEVVLGLRRAGVAVASLTHAAGLSSTGDDALDRALPWPERYEIPRRTIEAVGETRSRGGRVIAVGTTVVRALEAAAQDGEPRPGSGVATLRLDASYRPRVVSGLVSGLHAPGESHFELLSAFAPAERLRDALVLAAHHGLSSHELGDACLIMHAGNL